MDKDFNKLIIKELIDKDFNKLIIKELMDKNFNRWNLVIHTYKEDQKLLNKQLFDKMEVVQA